MAEKKSKKPSPPTIITLTLPAQDTGQEEQGRNGTLVIARGDLAHLGKFTYANLGDLTTAIKAGFVALAQIEADPPKDAAKPASTAKPGGAPEEKPSDEEPTVDVPLQKGKVAVKVSHLKIVAGESDAAAYRQAVLIAGRLIDGKLWDGQSPIRIHDVYTVAGKLKHLTDRDLSMFELTDFVQVGDAKVSSEMAQGATDQSSTDDAAPVAEAETISANGSSDQSALL